MKDIWEFKDVGKRNNICYTSESIRHPAKMELNMCREIIKKYSKKGDLILDPMAGIGTTIIEGMILGRNAIGIEYEQKFVDMGKANISKTSKSLKFMVSLGTGEIIKGDSRKLSDLLNKSADSILFSPPFANENRGAGLQTRRLKGELTKKDIRMGNCIKPISKDKNNIDNIKKYGKVDAIITSPPFADQNQNTKAFSDHKEDCNCSYCRKCKGNAGEMQGGIEYSEDKDNIGNLKHGKIDIVITSPPFEGVEPFHDKKFRDKYLPRKNADKGYTENKQDKKQVANLKGKTYLSEMLKIYKECFKVLKPEGFMVLVTKNFVRAGKQMRLDLDTIKLCEAAGFKLYARHYRKITNPSFWITNAIQKFEKKFPGKKHPYPLEEDILVFKKCQ